MVWFGSIVHLGSNGRSFWMFSLYTRVNTYVYFEYSHEHEVFYHSYFFFRILVGWHVREAVAEKNNSVIKWGRELRTEYLRRHKDDICKAK